MNEQQNFDILDIIEIIALGLQVKNDEDSYVMKQQLNRIEQKLDTLLSKL